MKRKDECTAEEWAEELTKAREWGAKARAKRGPEWNARRKLTRKLIRKDSSTPEEWTAYLESCRERLRAWRRKNSEKYNAGRRADYEENVVERQEGGRERYRKDAVKIAEQKRLRRTGMSGALFKKLIQLQNDLCAVCERPFEGGRRCADHDHDTMKPRGLLCIHCNTVEGHMKKIGISPTRFGARLEAYLDDPPAGRAEILAADEGKKAC